MNYNQPTRATDLGGKTNILEFVGQLRDPEAHWKVRGLCNDYAPDAWFPGKGEMNSANREALKLCLDCPVRQRCFAYAMDRNEQGIWGGSTEPERKALKAAGEKRTIRESSGRIGLRNKAAPGGGGTPAEGLATESLRRSDDG